MSRKQEIFLEIENKLAKDDYASTLPSYHPAKGRWKKGLRGEDKFNSLDEGALNKKISSGSNNPSVRGDKDRPNGPPEVEDPDEKEINPERDFPEREINYPGKEEIPDPDPEPEIQDPDEEEFGG